MPRVFDDEENIALLLTIIVIFFAGIFLAFNEGYTVYIIGYAILITIGLCAIISYVAISFIRSLAEDKDYEAELSSNLCRTADGQRPSYFREKHEDGMVF